MAKAPYKPAGTTLTRQIGIRLTPRHGALLKALQHEYGADTVSRTFAMLIDDAAAAYGIAEPESGLAAPEPKPPLAKEKKVARTYLLPTWSFEAIAFLRQQWSERSDAAVIAKALAICADAEDAKD